MIHSKIINDPTLSTDEKELHILCMWMALHEIIVGPQYFYLNPDGDMGLGILTYETIREYGPDFEKFKPIVLNGSTIVNLYRRDIKFEQSYDFTDLWKISSWDDLTSSWDSSETKPLVLTMLALTYSTTYIRENYF